MQIYLFQYRLAFAFLISTCTAGACAQANGSCTGFQRPLNPREIHREKLALNQRALQREDVLNVEIMRTLSDGTWTVVFAHPLGAEQGVFFFRGRGAALRLITVWGGSPGPDSVASIASTLDPEPPPRLKACVAETIHNSF